MNSENLAPAESRLLRRARQYMETQQLIAAQVALESLLQRTPHDVSVRMMLAQVLLQRGLLRAAGTQLLGSAQSPPANAQLLIQLVHQLYYVGEVVAARDCIDHLAQLPDQPAELLAVQAHLHWMLGEIPASKTAIDKALAAGVDAPDEYYLHAMLLQFTGDMVGAEGVLDTCVLRWPTFSGAAMALANVRKQTLASNHLDYLHQQVRNILPVCTQPGDNLIRAEFEAAIFKELDDLGQYDEAWLALERSNTLMHALNPYDAVVETAITDALISQSAAIRTGSSKVVCDNEGAIPIFIVGMPRSGTTLLDRMISNHSQVISAGESNDFVRQLHWMTDVVPGTAHGMLEAIKRSTKIDFNELGSRYLQQTQWRAQRRGYYIDKLPTNVQMVPFIRQALPHARILHMVREPMDVCFSNLRAMFGNTSSYSYDQHAVAHYYGQYARLTRHWRATVPDGMLDVSYAALVSEPEATLCRVLKHCGLDIEEGCLYPERNTAPVATPSSAQVREPIHTRGLGQWRRYAKQLEPLQRALAEQSLAEPAA